MSDRVITTGGGFGKKRRKVVVVVGNTYRIDSLNPNKLKNQGRVCQVTGFRTFGRRRDRYANVAWEDTGKYGWTAMDDFVEVPPGER